METQNVLALVLSLVAMFTYTPMRAAQADDGRIVSAAKKSYVYRTYLKSDDIRILSKDGAVTLEGEVVSPLHKSMAQDTVESLPGVKTVDNQLVVKEGNEKSDGRLEFNVKTALVFHRSVSATRTTVSVRDGLVTLSGTASSQAQKELTEAYAKDVEGVKGVKNEMTLAVETPAEQSIRTVGEMIDDASITAQVKSVLLTHRSTGMLKTRVVTREGVVTLAGEARNQAEKDLVTKLTSDIHGVKSVINNMTIRAALSNSTPRPLPPQNLRIVSR